MNKPILIVAATKEEVAPTIQRLVSYRQVSPSLHSGELSGKPVDILITGIGTTATTFHLTGLLFRNSYHMVISAGIAGTFSNDIAIGDVVQITRDCFADLGIDDQGTFLNLNEAGLVDANEHPFTENQIINPSPIPASCHHVSGITVQTTSGNKNRINELYHKYHPEIETMENAAFFYVCRMMQQSFASFRAISNKVEPRNRSNWNIPLSVKRVNEELLLHIRHIT